MLTEMRDAVLGFTTRKLVNLARRAIDHPTWLRETARSRIRARLDHRRPFSLTDHYRYLGTAEETVTTAYGISAERFGELSARVQVPRRDDGDRWSGGADLLTLAGVVVLLTRPQTVVETGVALGFTSAVILAALEENGGGQLHSVDLPPLEVDPTFVGQVVPQQLRGRWSLRLGPTRTVLPALTRAIAPIDLFVHDSDHSYAGQIEDYRFAWPSLVAGGTFISDDIGNAAFLDFAAEVGEQPYLVGSRAHGAAVGLLVKGRGHLPRIP